MITFDEASAIVAGCSRKLSREHVALADSLGRVLTQDIFSDIDIPPFDASAMDGYACRSTDLDMPLTVIETIAAGSRPKLSVGRGGCAKIMTGAPMPSGADMVVMFEHTQLHEDVMTVIEAGNAKNIRYRGEDVKQGDIVLHAGARITPAILAALASVGCDPVPVAQRPVIGVIATGNELIEPAHKPAAAQIRNSNGYQLCAQIQRAGCVSQYFGIVPDNPESLRESLQRALCHCDVVILSGGVSEGEFDYVPGVMAAEGIEMKFSGIAVKPGKPAVFGAANNKYVFGLPGNPVSTYVIFEMLVRPFLMLLSGCKETAPVVRAQLGETISRKKMDRMEFLPVRISSEGIARRVEYHGSGHIHAYCFANGIITIPAGIFELKKDSPVDVQHIE